MCPATGGHPAPRLIHISIFCVKLPGELIRGLFAAGERYCFGSSFFSLGGLSTDWLRHLWNYGLGDVLCIVRLFIPH